MSIKLIILDSDGTIIDLRDLHYQALNKALESIDPSYVISLEDHVNIYDGLSTKNKLSLLNKAKGFPLEKVNEINELKQKFTIELLKDFENINWEIPKAISKLKDAGHLIYVASNSVTDTIIACLQKLKIDHLIDKVFSNQDVKVAKPNPEIYLKCMADASVSPDETLIIEDSKHGREAAVKSGAHVCGLDNSFDFTYERIKEALDVKNKPVKWAGKSDLTVLIPMAGAGSRFKQEGFKLPKPLIDVNGKPMIQRVIDNLNMDAKFVFVVQKDHYEQYNLGSYLSLMVPGCEIVQTDGLTDGAACSTLLAKEYINNDNHLLIANSDQLVIWDSCDFMQNMLYHNLDGGILTFEANNPKWSYVKKDSSGFVTEVAEKQVISNEATIGIYYFKKGSEYVRLTEQMIAKNIRTNGEFYVAPVYNEMFLESFKVKTYQAEKNIGLGTPADLSFYLENYYNITDSGIKCLSSIKDTYAF